MDWTQYRRADGNKPFFSLYFDGLCEPNPGGIATFGYAIGYYHEEGEWVDIFSGGEQVLLQVERTTNNVAEYYALGKALRILKENEFQGHLNIYGDSQLVINQVKGTWRSNTPFLTKLRDRCQNLIQEIDPIQVDLIWIPREENEICDQLARDAYKKVTGRNPPVRNKKK